MKTHKRRPTKAQRLLATPQMQNILRLTREIYTADDIAALTRLFCLLHGRIMRRDPRQVARRYLRRIRPGQWYAGGSHVARYDFGPGIAWRAHRDDRPEPLHCFLINATLHLPSSTR